jgi:type IV pilus biogenesis protein CpaD/CtpE
MLDVKRLIGEVAAQNGIRVEPDDPVFALATINQIMLNEAMREFSEQIRERMAEFEESFGKAERRAGHVLAQEVKEAAAQMRQELQKDIHAAGMKAREIVHQVNEANRRSNLMRWTTAGVVAGALLFGGGVWLGTLMH